MKLRIHDTTERGPLAFDLREVLELLGPSALAMVWNISPVSLSPPDGDVFEATGEGGEQLGALAQGQATISGANLMALAAATQQVIWGEFSAAAPGSLSSIWLTIRAIAAAMGSLAVGVALTVYFLRGQPRALFSFCSRYSNGNLVHRGSHVQFPALQFISSASPVAGRS